MVRRAHRTRPYRLWAVRRVKARPPGGILPSGVIPTGIRQVIPVGVIPTGITLPCPPPWQARGRAGGGRYPRLAAASSARDVYDTKTVIRFRASPASMWSTGKVPSSSATCRPE